MILKRFINIFLFFVIFLSVSCTAYAVAPRASLNPSDYDYGVTLEEALAQKDKAVLANFYVDWCGYCRRFAPVLDKIRSVYKDKYQVVMVDCENPKNRKFVEEYYVGGYPTVYLINPKNGNRSLLPGGILDRIDVIKKEMDRFYQFNMVDSESSK